eukprot:c31415_g1_i1 orf=164-319(+)
MKRNLALKSVACGDASARTLGSRSLILDHSLSDQSVFFCTSFLECASARTL